MLKVFRDNLRYLSWVLWFVIAVFILFVFVDFGGTVPGGGAVSDSAASVGKHEISYVEFERAYRRAEDFYRETYGEQFSTEFARQIGLPRQVLDSLIADKILLADAKRMGLAVTDEEVRREILRLPVFQSGEGRFIGEGEYARILRANGLTVEGFEADMRRDLLTQKVRSVLEHNIFVPDADVEAAYREQVEKARIRYLRLPAARFRDAAEIAPAEIEAYFAEHREEFRVPERRIVDYLLVDRAEVERALQIDDAEIERYYEEHRDEYTRDEQVRARHILLRTGADRTAEEAEAEIAAIRARVEGGEAFADVAAEVSEDPGSKDRGGDLGFFGRGDMVPEFEQAAFAAEAGSLAGPVRSPFGVHLIEVLERRAGGAQPLEAVRDSIASQLTRERAQTAAENRAQELAETAREDKAADWQALAGEQPGVSMQTSAPFAEDDHVDGIGRATAFSVAAFALEEPGATSDPVKIGKGWAILRLVEIQPPHLPELDAVRAEVEAALRDERQLQLARERLAEAADSLRAEGAEDGGLDALAAELGVEVEESEPFGRGGAVGGLGRNPAVVRAALALDEGRIGGPIMDGDGGVIFEVVERVRFDPEAFAEVREATRERLEQERFAQNLAAYLDARRQKLGVRFSPDLVENFDLLGTGQTG